MKRRKLRSIIKQVTDKLTAATLGANFGTFNFDIINNKLQWDDSMYRIYGVDKANFTGEYEAWRSGLHPDDIARCDNEVALAISGEKNFDSEFRIIWPDGQIRHIRGIIVVQRGDDGTALRMTGTNWDVTALKEAQLKLQKSEESFQAAFDASNIGMALINLDGKWAKVNKSLCNSLGYSEDEIIKIIVCCDITHPDDLAKDQLLFNELVGGRTDGYQTEKRYFHKNGDIVYLIIAVTAVKKINGELSHVISQILDISKRIDAEKRLTKLVDVAKEQNDSLLNFAHIVSHNLTFACY